MTNDEIYGLFCAADYNKLKLLQVLADVAGIDVYELINIIEKKENGIMARHKWTDEENTELIRLHGSGVKCWVLASKFGTSEANIRWRVRHLKKAGKDTVVKKQERTAVEWIDDDACTGENVHDLDRLCNSILKGTAIEKAAEEVPDKPTNAAIVDEIEAVENEAVEKLHGETIADKCESCRYNTGDYVCHPHCSGCDGRSKFESAQDKPCRNVYEMARDAITEIERMAGGMVADRIEITAIDNRISAAARDEECNEVTFSRRLEKTEGSVT